MLGVDEEKPVLQHEEPPFAPPSVEAVPVPANRLEQALLWSQRWRLPLTLLFGLLIAAAAFFAYRSQIDDPLAAVDRPPADEAAAEGDGSAPVEGNSSDSEADADSVGGPANPAGGGDEAADRQVSATTSTTDTDRLDPSSTTPATTRRTSSTATSTTTPATRPTTTAAPTTATTRSTTTTRPTTTAAPTTTAPPRPGFIGDRVTEGGWDGPGVSGVRVSLLEDRNRDGVGDQTILTAVTDGNGRYGFQPDPGCYVVSFTVPNGRSVILGTVDLPVCLDSGESNGRADLVFAARPVVDPPPSCNVQIGDGRFAGVEIVDPNRDWAPSYAFYGAGGNFLLSTSSLGPPDDTTNPSRDTIEWTSFFYGYEESLVYSVAAEDGAGNRSAPVSCERRNL